MVGELQSEKHFIAAWNVVAVLTVIVPLLIFWIARRGARYNRDQGDQNDQYNQQYDYDEYGNYLGPHRWWQFWRSTKNYNNEGGEEDDREDGAPWWYFWGPHEGDPEEEGRGVLIFIYLCTLMMLVVVTIQVRKLMAAGEFRTLRWLLLGFAAYSFAVVVLLAGLDAVKVEGREIEETGWYGQTSVLVLLTCLFNMFESIGFAVWTRYLKKKEPENNWYYIDP